MQKDGGWTNWYRVAIAGLEAFLLFISYILSFFLRYGRYVPARNFDAFQGAIGWILIVFIIFNLLFGVYILYNKTHADLFFITVIIQGLLAVFTMVLSFAGRWLAFPRTVILIDFFVSIIILFCFRAMVFNIYRRYTSTKRVMIVGVEDEVFPAIFNFKSSKSTRHIVTHVVLSDYYENVKARLDEFDIVYLASQIDEDEKLKIYDLLMRENKKLFLNSKFENLVMVNPNIMNFEDESIIETSDFAIPADQELIKRGLDILMALAILIVASPIMLVTALLVKLTSPGPVFYRQTRITKGGEEFEILKFRSMSATAEDKSGPVIATKNDSRVTSVGKFIRATRIDELPQVINVLKGEMSMIGPRPERPFFVDQFQAQNPHYYLRHNVRAGITGYAQVYGKYASDFNSKLNFDLIYIKKYHLILDFKILLQTIKILFDKVSSSGIDENAKPTVTREEINNMRIELVE
ncbi:UDP-phosphate galactose phosphotransferase [Aerococcus urinaehominis]|uniref:UDP-phosphate galactose phosphotransferase n=1 Tax=Aerococcus urinaehominis TaxID=128944 RepID=A0A109RH73_9LACT|nr:sugar transferase [Aerococcus urinaehominis]AMB99411.1 UDP-phosphate galactose phosphotransferase [Aerococcus urinaehominis]SDM24342.1 exopolysaccharide biosynthesis polyprenyl glycosylphosphotransferase [Aerococcus urinaehominis]